MLAEQRREEERILQEERQREKLEKIKAVEGNWKPAFTQHAVGCRCREEAAGKHRTNGEFVSHDRKKQHFSILHQDGM